MNFNIDNYNIFQKNLKTPPKGQEGGEMNVDIIDEKLDEFLNNSKQYQDTKKDRAELINIIYGEKASERFLDCNTTPSFIVDTKGEDETTLFKSNFCHAIYCEHCQKIKSVYRTKLNAEIIERGMKKHPNAKLLMITINPPNFEENRILEQVKNFKAGLSKLMKRKIWKDVYLSIFNYEITFKKDGTINFHVHILMLKKTYFNRKESKYFNPNQKDIVSEIKDILNLEKDPMVYCEKADLNTVREVSKYTVKGNEIWTDDRDKNIRQLSILKTLEKTHFTEWNGEAKKLKKEIEQEWKDEEKREEERKLNEGDRYIIKFYEYINEEYKLNTEIPYREYVLNNRQIKEENLKAEWYQFRTLLQKKTAEQIERERDFILTVLMDRYRKGTLKDTF